MITTCSRPGQLAVVCRAGHAQTPLGTSSVHLGWYVATDALELPSLDQSQVHCSKACPQDSAHPDGVCLHTSAMGTYSSTGAHPLMVREMPQTCSHTALAWTLSSSRGRLGCSAATETAQSMQPWVGSSTLAR